MGLMNTDLHSMSFREIFTDDDFSSILEKQSRGFGSLCKLERVALLKIDDTI